MTEPPTAVVTAVRRARSGDQAGGADELRALVESPEPLIAWTATAALLPWLWWQGEFASAARRVERTVMTVGPVADRAGLPEVGRFVTAFAAAAHYDGVDVTGSLDALPAVLPPGHPQRRVFEQTARRVASDPVSLLPARVPDPEPMLSGPATLATRRPARLSAREAETVMLEAINCGQRELVLRWIDAGVSVPDRSWALLWAAQMLLEAGRPEPVEQLLVREATAWEPFEGWDTTSPEIPLGVVTRDLVTPAIRRAHLEQPVGAHAS